MNQPNGDTLSRLGNLTLLWLLSQSDKKGTRSKLHRAFSALLEQRWSTAEQRKALEEELTSLERAGHISCPRRGALVITKSGRRAGLAALGLEKLPSNTDWKVIKRRYLLAHALEFTPPFTPLALEHIAKIDGIRAALLARHHGLELGDAPTLRQVRDVLAWRAIGVETQEPFTLSAVLKLLLNRTLGETKQEEPEKLLAQLAAKTVGARRAEVEEFRHAVLRRWLEGPPPALTPREEAASTPDLVEVSALPEDDSDFAECVLAAAKASKTGRFGEDKVFISHVFQRLRDEGVAAGDLETFKSRLVSVHRLGLLSLSRGDLVEAMPPDDVNASETAYLSATFHFVRI